MGGRVHYQEARDRGALGTLFGRGQTSNNNKTNQQPSQNDLLPTASRYSSVTLAIFSQLPLKAVSVVRNVYYSNFATPAAQTKAVIFFVHTTPDRCVDCVFAGAPAMVHAIKCTASLFMFRKTYRSFPEKVGTWKGRSAPKGRKHLCRLLKK